MTFRSLLLGSAAALVTVGGAQAADLAVAAPVSYVKVCDAFGPGYWYAPGTQTCIKIGGHVKFDVIIANGTGGLNDSYTTSDDHQFRTSLNLNVTAKSMTEMGPLTGYINMDLAPTYTPGGGESTMQLDAAYVEWGPLLVGHTGSLFALQKSLSETASLGVWGSHQDQIRLSFGAGGVKFAIAAEDYRDSAKGVPTGAIPDIVGSIDFNAGILSLKAVGGYGARVGHSTWGIGGQASLALDPIGKGSYIAVWGSYSANTADFVDSFLYSAAMGAAPGGVGDMGSWYNYGGAAVWQVMPKLALGIAGAHFNGEGATITKISGNIKYILATNLYAAGEVFHVMNNGDPSVAAITGSTAGTTFMLRLRRDFP